MQPLPLVSHPNQLSHGGGKIHYCFSFQETACSPSSGPGGPSAFGKWPNWWTILPALCSPHNMVLVVATPASYLFPFITPQNSNFCSGQLESRWMSPLCLTVTVCGLVLCVLKLNQSKLTQREHCLSLQYIETKVLFPVCTVLLAQKGWKYAPRLSEMGKYRWHKWVLTI